MRNEIVRKVGAFKKEYGIKEATGPALKKAAEALGYTVICFNNVLNDKNVAELIEALDLSELAENSRGFTYVDGDYRLIFIHEGLSSKESAVVLAHELGHIVCDHLKHGSAVGYDVSEEYEANEFAHYLLTLGTADKIRKTVDKNQKAVTAVLILLIILIVGIFTVNTVNAKTRFYITETGFKYHKKDCIYVKDKENVTCVSKKEISEGNYTPCEVCLAGQ